MPDNELLLLLACARTDVSSEGQRVIADRVADPDLDWRRFRRLVARHRVESLVYVSLERVVPMAGRSDRLSQLPGAYQVQRTTAMQNLVWTRELIKLFDGFERRGVGAMPYKGPVLTHQAHGRIDCRRTHDLDVLVRACDLEACFDVMRLNGYEPQEPLSRFGRVAARYLSKDYVWVHQTTGLLVEIHQRPVEPRFHFGVTTDDLFRSSTTYQWGGREWPVFRPEEYVLVLSVHGCLHEWGRLHWLCVFAGYCRAHPGLDWPGIGRLAARAGCQRSLAVSLLLLKRFWPDSVPDASVHAHRSVDAERVADEIQARWGIEEMPSRSLVETTGGHLFFLETRRHRLAYVLGLLCLAGLRPLFSTKTSGAELAGRPLDLITRHRITPGQAVGVITKIFQP